MIGTMFRGNIGNQMFQYAFMRSVSERNGYDFFISGRAKQFDETFPQLQYKKGGRIQTSKPVRNVVEMEFLNEQDCLKQNFLEKGVLNDNTFIDGFFQNYSFDREDCRKWFDIYLNETEIEENTLRETYNPHEYCYINFRGNEFLLYDILRTPESFFVDAKNHVPKKKFLVITDDLNGAKSNVNADYYISPNYKIALKLLTCAKELIIPDKSTFSWWGAWIGNAEIVISLIRHNEEWRRNNFFTYI